MPPSSGSRRTWTFFGGLAALALLRFGLGFVSLPAGAVPYANLGLAAIYLAVPILSMYVAADAPWTPSRALIAIGIGVALQFGLFYADRALGTQGAVSGFLGAISQMGLPIWCAGLGALLATLLKDKNLILPLAIFMGFLDAFLVFSPFGVTNIVLKQAPRIFESVAAAVPKVGSEPATGRASAGAFIGPADFVFLAMFFVALFRFHMRTEATLRWMIPALLLYLVTVLVFGFPLPALIPIGLVVLLVNWQEFKLTKDEKVATLFAGALGAGLFTWGMFQQPKLVTPEKPSAGQVTPAPARSPE